MQEQGKLQQLSAKRIDNYLHSDHLGSTSVTTCGNTACGTVGSVFSRQRYYPYGGVLGRSP